MDSTAEQDLDHQDETRAQRWVSCYIESDGVIMFVYGYQKPRDKNMGYSLRVNVYQGDGIWKYGTDDLSLSTPLSKLNIGTLDLQASIRYLGDRNWRNEQDRNWQPAPSREGFADYVNQMDAIGQTARAPQTYVFSDQQEAHSSPPYPALSAAATAPSQVKQRPDTGQGDPEIQVELITASLGNARLSGTGNYLPSMRRLPQCIECIFGMNYNVMRNYGDEYLGNRYNFRALMSYYRGLSGNADERSQQFRAYMERVNPRPSSPKTQIVWAKSMNLMQACLKNLWDPYLELMTEENRQWALDPSRDAELSGWFIDLDGVMEKTATLLPNYITIRTGQQIATSFDLLNFYRQNPQSASRIIREFYRAHEAPDENCSRLLECLDNNGLRSDQRNGLRSGQRGRREA